MLAKELGISTSNTHRWYFDGSTPSRKVLPKILEICERVRIEKSTQRVFICSPYRASGTRTVEQNVEAAKKLCRAAARAGHIPFAPHLLYPQFLDDTDERDRNTGIRCGVSFLEKCDVVWVLGEPTEGMRHEIAKAQELKIPVVTVTQEGVAL